jgi:hypothetical protein
MNLTVEALLSMRDRLKALPPVPHVKIFESDAAVQRGDPVKVYPKHKARTPAHLKRMRKKWIKRYGYTQVACIFEMRNGLFGANERIIVVHPSLARQLRAAFKEHV